MGKRLTKIQNIKKKVYKFLNACFTTKEGANSKNYGSTVIPKV